MVINFYINIFFLNLFFIAPVMSMDNYRDPDHDILFLWRILSQGNFVVSLPVELRKTIWEYAVKDHMLLCSSLMRETVFLGLPLVDLMRYNRKTLHGIRTIDAGCASKVYDVTYKLGRTTCWVSQEEYENARSVPANIKIIFSKKEPIRKVCTFERIPFSIGTEGTVGRKVVLLLR